VRWAEGSGQYGLTQETHYPMGNTVRIRMAASQPKEYTLYVRIPGWTSDPVLSVNGKPVTEGVQPGTFAAVRRTWKEGDVVELELSMPLRLEEVDVQHPNQVALLRGPLVLFGVADSQPSFEKAELLRAKPTNNATGDSIANSADGKPVSMRPFMGIQEESYSTYVSLKS
jgi:uncharacterized protein